MKFRFADILSTRTLIPLRFGGRTISVPFFLCADLQCFREAFSKGESKERSLSCFSLLGFLISVVSAGHSSLELLLRLPVLLTAKSVNIILRREPSREGEVRSITAHGESRAIAALQVSLAITDEFLDERGGGVDAVHGNLRSFSTNLVLLQPLRET